MDIGCSGYPSNGFKQRIWPVPTALCNTLSLLAPNRSQVLTYKSEPTALTKRPRVIGSIHIIEPKCCTKPKGTLFKEEMDGTVSIKRLTTTKLIFA